MQVYAWMEYQLLIFRIWSLKCFILHQTNQPSAKVKYEETRCVTPHQASTPKTKRRFQLRTTIFDLNNVDCVPSNAKFSRFGAMLYIFEDNEAVIKMIIKGRCPTMRHVSRTHRVALDRLFDRINLDAKIQIKYVDTEHQLADIMFKGTSHVMNGIIHCVCSTSAISVPPIVLK